MVGKLEILCAEPCGTGGLSTQNEPPLLKPSSSKSLIFFIEVKWKSLNHVRLFETPWTVARQAPLSMGILQARILEWVAMLSSRDLPNPGIQHRSPVLQANSLLSESPSKPKNTGVGSLSLCQGIVPTQESDWGLLHCRQILYQLSYQGSPHIC